VPKTYQVKNIFPTIQGEAFWAGTPAVFVRLVACNMWDGREEHRERDARRNTPGDDPHGCPMWCDTDFTPEGSEGLAAPEIAGRIEKYGSPPLVVFTGGEPLLQLDGPLLEVVHERTGAAVTVETNGTFTLEQAFGDASHELESTPDWVCCSPKLPQEQLEIEACDEAKLIVPDFVPDDYGSLAKKCRKRRTPMGRQRHLYVQPEDGPRFEEACWQVRRIAQENSRWRISTQSHKTIGAA